MKAGSLRMWSMMLPTKVSGQALPKPRQAAFASGGFSLVELLVCICVMGFLTSMAAPYLGAVLQNYQAQAAARQLVTDLQLARMKAVAQKTNYSVTFDSANKRYTVSMGVTPVFTRNLSDYSQSLTLTDNFTNDKVTFTPVGQASQAGTTTLTASGSTTRVAVTPVGGVYVQ